jgi:lysophospholipase L1-like esterase
MQYRFTNLLETELQSSSSKSVAVLNFGRGGADTKQEISMLEDAAKVNPDIVLLCYLANDIDGYIQMPVLPMHESALERRLTVLSPTYNFVYWRARAPEAYRQFGEDYFQAIYRAYRDSATIHRHLQDIDELIMRVRSKNARPVFVILPFPSLWQHDQAATSATAVANRQLRDQVYATITQRVRSLGVPLIEAQGLEEEMPVEEFVLNPMDGHPNEAAHRRIAQILGSEFSRQDLLQK